MKSLNFYTFSLILIAGLVSADDPYIPCQSFISFSYDDSNFIRNEDFKTQLTFISLAIGPINYPDRLRLEGAYTTVAAWESHQTTSQMQNELNNVQQTAISYSLLQQFASLVTTLSLINGTSWPIGALVFIADTSDNALRNADRFLPQLSGVQLTFVLLGPDADQNKLTQFSSNFITWRDLSQPQPDNWDNVASAAYGCIGSISTITVPSVTTASTMSVISSSLSPNTGSTAEQYIPCQSWISFSYDDANVLQNADFEAQMLFISSVIGSINFPNRLRIQGAYTDVATWNSGQNIGQMQTELSNSEKTTNGYSLLLEFANLVNYLPTNDWPVGALVFISDTSDNALKNAFRFMPQLANVHLTFVLLGSNADATKLTNFSSNFIYWTDLSKPQPDNWDNAALSAFGCSNPSSVSSLPSTSVPLSSTVQTGTSSSAVSSTAPTGSTFEPYFPCQSWISFSYDDSNTLQYNDYKTQMSFISTAIGSINYPDRLRLEGAYTGVAGWESHQTIPQMQNELNNLQQTAISYSLLQEFASLVTTLSLINGTSWPIGALVFISDTSDNALRNADRFMPQLSGVQLTFVLLGPNADQSKLTQFSSNFITWRDLTQPQPDNWDQMYPTAYGCSNPSSVSFPPSLSTSLPSTGVTTIATGSTLVPTGSTVEPYQPCQSWISFSYDDSNVLQNNDYKTQMSFISTAIGVINYPDRLRVDGTYTSVASWESRQTIAQIQNELSFTQQTANAFSLLQQFATLVTNLEITNDANWPIGALIFISDTSDNAIRNADRFMPALSKVQLTFVLLGPNAEAAKLTNFSSNFIYWSDLSKPLPDNWDTTSLNAFGCSNPSSISLPPPLSTSLPLTSTAPGISTAGSTQAPTGTPILPYLPCQSWISFSYDDSSALQNSGFRTHLAFIASELENLNYPDRLRINGAFTGVASWNSHQVISQMQNEINALEQTQNSYSLLQEFATLLTDYAAIQNTTTWPIGALIFISDTSDRALSNANILFPRLAGVRITFVLLGTNVDQTKLTQYSNNFITWPDLSESQPDDWLEQSYAAYGCQ